MNTKLLGAVAALALFAAGNSAVRADSIGIGGFGPTASLTDLDNIGNCCGAAFTAPLTVGIYTFTTDDGLLRYNAIGFNNSPNLANNTDLGFIDIAIASGANVTKFGFLVGLAGAGQPHQETVSFFDTSNVLLGSIGVSSGGGLQFVGWENAAGVGRALVTDTLINSSVVTVDNLLSESPVSSVPLAPSWVSQLTGLGLLGMLVWWRKRNVTLSS